MGKVIWNGDAVLKLVQKARDAMVRESAFLIEANAKLNIRENGQVDTGFMWNSVYTQTDKGDSTYGEARAEATARASEKDFHMPAKAPQDGAVVAVGAEYGIVQEMEVAFLYPAVVTVAKQGEAEIVAKGKGAL